MTTTPADAARASSTAASTAAAGSSVDPHAVTISGVVLDWCTALTNRLLKLRDVAKHIAEPGQFLYTRVVPCRGTGRFVDDAWQSAGFGSADDTNKRFKYLLRAGTDREQG
ncbi:MAG: hypothetical protein R3B68_14445 [Phycisphaerales bacterium]